jgi:hypothetical protein
MTSAVLLLNSAAEVVAMGWTYRAKKKAKKNIEIFGREICWQTTTYKRNNKNVRG